MNAKLSIVSSICVVLSACGSRPESLIVGKWEVASASVGGTDAQALLRLQRPSR